MRQAGFKETGSSLSIKNWLVVDRQREITKAENAFGIWPPGALLAVVLGDLKTNREKLLKQRMDLAAIGVNLTDWLVEYHGHLYDAQGREKIEPVLSWEYLIEVAQAMWRLSTGVFAQTLFSYEELAADVGDYDLQKVKLATRRLAILMEEPSKVSRRLSKASHSALQVFDKHWRWDFKSQNSQYSHVRNVLTLLERLAMLVTP